MDLWVAYLQLRSHLSRPFWCLCQRPCPSASLTRARVGGVVGNGVRPGGAASEIDFWRSVIAAAPYRSCGRSGTVLLVVLLAVLILDKTQD